jgi:hypothetical protein
VPNVETQATTLTVLTLALLLAVAHSISFYIVLVLGMSFTPGIQPLAQSYKMVRTEYERREEGFLALGSYFDGSNSAGLRLNETQPIIMRHDQRRVRQQRLRRVHVYSVPICLHNQRLCMLT